MIAGLVGILDQLDDAAGWHLADVARYPLATFCGAGTPEPMSRSIRPARRLRIETVCADCVDVWGVSDGGEQLRGAG